ncbi:SIS domain-containing protein [Parasulfitobacter algicola]|uniref:MurR/RpiR family transcriptional regulator n=1 Tax=Parasulfitobacter algicola TaxID=2614809 RepID=A0ABX2IQC2_9RHOB|nr:MurR/RpiR family transcriptional regulator [Sulfitobacter algicola]
MSVLEKFADAATNLTPNERLLIRTVIENPASAALGTANELAKTVGVHEATASRLARKLGYENYAGFRDALRNEFIATRETATRFEKTISNATSESILGTLALQEMQALAQIEDFINPDQINAAAKQLMSARQVFIYGYGNAETLALMTLKRFRRFGMAVHKLAADPRTLAEQALELGADDAVLIFAFRRSPRGYLPLIETARETDAKTIVIADAIGPMLVPQPDHLLAAPRSGTPDGFQTLTIPMTITNAVIIAAGLDDKTDTLKKLERLGQLIERFE